MSDASQGPGWWLASDGKWYAPESALPPPPPISQSSMETPAESQTGEPDRISGFRRIAKPDALRKGVHVALGALESSGLAKVDRESGEVKVKKLGLAKAALRPGKTIRKAINGATADLVRGDKTGISDPILDSAPKEAQ